MKILYFKLSIISLAIFSIFSLQSCGETKVDTEKGFSINRPIGSEIDVFWNLVENGYKGKSSYLAEFMITNNSIKTLDSTGWAVYFHQPRRVIMESTSQNIEITHVNGDLIKEMNLGSAVRRLRGKPGTDVSITIRRPGVGSFLVTITRAIINVKPVKWHVEENVGIIRLTRFNLRSIDDLEDAVQKIHLELGSTLKGIVLDLRNNPGGLLNQSVAIADAFLNLSLIHI